MAKIEWKDLGDNLKTAEVKINGFDFVIWNQDDSIFWATKGDYACSRKYPKLPSLLRNLEQTFTEKVRRSEERFETRGKAFKLLGDILSDNEALELIWFSVCMRRNYIETGKVHMSADDARRSGRHDTIKNLDSEQVETVKKLDKIAQAFFDCR